MKLDWSQCAAVESVPGKVSGGWVFRGTCLPVATVFENLEDGMSIEEIMEQFDVAREQVTAGLGFSAKSLAAPVRPRCSFFLTPEPHPSPPQPPPKETKKKAKQFPPPPAPP